MFTFVLVTVTLGKVRLTVGQIGHGSRAGD